jgi:hypothetical protein
MTVLLLALLAAFFYMLWRRRLAKRGAVSALDPVVMGRYLLGRQASSGHVHAVPASRVGRVLGRLR